MCRLVRGMKPQAAGVRAIPAGSEPPGLARSTRLASRTTRRGTADLALPLPSPIVVPATPVNHRIDRGWRCAQLWTRKKCVRNRHFPIRFGSRFLCTRLRLYRYPHIKGSGDAELPKPLLQQCVEADVLPPIASTLKTCAVLFTLHGRRNQIRSYKQTPSDNQQLPNSFSYGMCAIAGS